MTLFEVYFTLFLVILRVYTGTGSLDLAILHPETVKTGQNWSNYPILPQNH